MQIIKSKLFQNIDDVVFGFSTKTGLDRLSPYFFNLSLSVGDKRELVEENRNYFFNSLGLNPENIVYQKQVHGDIIKFAEVPGNIGESDALISKSPGLALTISTADCTPIFIYDKTNKVIAAVHSGWRGTQKIILKKTLNNLSFHFKSEPADLIAYIGPSISQKNYEVGPEVAVLFDQTYLRKINGKLYLDVMQANVDMLLQSGIPESQIEVSGLCTFEEKDLLHSYRRDGKISGRALGVIALI